MLPGPVTAKGTGPQSYRARVDRLAPPIQREFQQTAGGDVSANKRTSKRNDPKPVISTNTGHRATCWVINIHNYPPLVELIIRDFETIFYNRLYTYTSA